MQEWHQRRQGTDRDKGTVRQMAQRVYIGLHELEVDSEGKAILLG